MFLNSKKTMFGSKKTQENTHEWAVVILKPLKTEIKEALVQRIIETFKMSLEEARTVADNTPIIFLDHLSQTTAAELKEFFRPTGAEMFLTDDLIIKSKCYRTVWPDLPNLSFLQKAENLISAEPPLDVKIATAPIVPVMKTPELPPLPIEKETAYEPVKQEFVSPIKKDVPQSPPTPVGLPSSKQLMQDFDSWKEKYEAWKATFHGLTAEVEKLRGERQALEETISSSNAFIEDQVRKNEEQKGMLESMESSCKNLQKEYYDAKERFEKQLGGFEEESVAWKAKIKAMTEKMVDLDQWKQDLHKIFCEQKEKCEKLEEAYNQVRSMFEQKVRQSSREIEIWKANADDLVRKMESLANSQNLMERIFTEQSDKFTQLEESYQLIQDLIRENAEFESDSVLLSHAREKQVSEKLEQLEKLQVQVMQDLHERIQTDQALHTKVSEWDSELNELRKAQQELEQKFLASPYMRRRKAADTGTGQLGFDKPM